MVSLARLRELTPRSACVVRFLPLFLERVVMERECTLHAPLQHSVKARNGRLLFVPAAKPPAADKAASRRIRWRRCAGARLVRADWLDAVQTLDPASVDLLYADPPFTTGRRLRSGGASFDDRWPSLDAWLDWLRVRLEATLPALAPAGAILLHCDWRTSHRVRVLLDELVGERGFVNHLVWAYGLGGSSPRRFARKHDDILYYSLDPSRCYFDPPLVPATSRRMHGRRKKATDVLTIPAINNMARERVGYPTQKPLALLELLIRACCPPGGLVLDPCCGSGTTLVAALRAGRRAVGCDVGAEAVELTARR
ncbi:MAG: site-specific DNA-methyltransferase, partial [Planctomycetota bacterium]